MQRFFLFTLAICFASPAFSQTNFRNGYIITNERDTIVGLVDYRERTNAHESCDFKRSEGEQTTTYKPGDILGYGFAGDTFFESKVAQIKDSKPAPVFLEVVIKGLVSLYKFGDTFYIDKEGEQQPHQLSDEQKEIFVDGRKILKNTNQHIGIMKALMYDCPELAITPTKVSVREKSLAAAVERYNSCKGTKSVTFKARKRRTEVAIGFVAGLNVSTLQFETNDWNYYYYLAKKFGPAKSPVVGMSFDFLWPRLSNRASLHVDLLFSKSQYHSHVEDSSEPPVKSDVTFDVKQVKVPIGVRYAFPGKALSPFFEAGIASITHSSTASQWIEKVDHDGTTTTFDRTALRMKHSRGAIWIGLGVLKPITKKVDGSLNFRYERDNGVSANPAINSSIHTFQTTIGIRLK